MNRVTVIDFSKQPIDLEKLIPDNTEIILVPKRELNNTVLGGDLVYFLHRFLDNIEKMPMYDINNPVYIIINATAQAFAASLFLKTYFSTVHTSVTVWVLRNEIDDNGLYLDMNCFEMEGIDRGYIYLEVIREMLQTNNP